MNISQNLVKIQIRNADLLYYVAGGGVAWQGAGHTASG